MDLRRRSKPPRPRSRSERRLREHVIDPSARFEAESLGAGSRVLAYVQVAPEVTIGANCVLHEHAVLSGPVTLEQGVSASGRAPFWAGENAREIVVHRFASIGANATVLPGVLIGRRAVVEPGSVVTQSVPANAVVSGNPARIVAYVDSGHEAAAPEAVALCFCRRGLRDEGRRSGATRSQ